jgi:hypothetical protein
MYYNLLLTHSENKIKTTWDIVIETGKWCQAKCALSAFKNENNSAIHPNHIADAFNSYFLSFIDKLNDSTIQADTAILY